MKVGNMFKIGDFRIRTEDEFIASYFVRIILCKLDIIKSSRYERDHDGGSPFIRLHIDV